MATFKRVRRRVISAAAPLGKATGFCVSREAPGRFGRKVSTGFGPARKYFSPNVFGGLVKIRDKLSLKMRDKRGKRGPFRCRVGFGIILVSNWETEFMPISKMIETVKDYPIEDRVVFADAILQSINPIDPEVERKWIDLAQHRRGEYLQGHVTPIPSEEVFAEAKVRARA